jgi:hypothetical protein
MRRNEMKKCKHPNLICKFQRPALGDSICENRSNSCPNDNTQPLPKPTPETVEINEELFGEVDRGDIGLLFYIQIFSVHIIQDGRMYGSLSPFTPEQLNEIIRVRHELGWDKGE